MSDDSPAELLAGAATELAHHGFPAMPARVVMALTASEEGRLTAEELATRLGASPAAISGAVRYLGTLGFVRAATLPGSRRHVYSLPHTPWYTATLTRPGVYRNLTELLTAAAARMAEDSPARERIEEMVDFFRFFERRMPELLEEWHQQRPVRTRAGTGAPPEPDDGPPTT